MKLATHGDSECMLMFRCAILKRCVSSGHSLIACPGSQSSMVSSKLPRSNHGHFRARSMLPMTHRTSLFRYISEIAHFTSDTDCGRPSGRQRQPTHISVTSLLHLSDIRDLVRTSRHNSQVRRRKGNPMNKHPTDAKHRTVPTATTYCTAAASTARHDRAINSTPLRRHSSRPRQSRSDHLRQDHAQATASSPCACRPCSSL